MDSSEQISSNFFYPAKLIFVEIKMPPIINRVVTLLIYMPGAILNASERANLKRYLWHRP